MRITANNIKKNMYVSFKAQFGGRPAWIEVRVTSVQKASGSVTIKGVIPGMPGVDGASRVFRFFPDEVVCRTV